MKVFVAGATGVVGQPLVKQLVEAGHEVTGLTRTDERARSIRLAGATCAICDALDAEELTSAVVKASPDVIINQLTSLPASGDQRDPEFFTRTNELRGRGGHILIEAAQAAGVKRFITQSIAFTYAREGSWVKDETAPTVSDFEGSFGESFRVMLAHEQELARAEGIEGLILRYGFFYGPGTFYAGDGATADEVRGRKFPVVGPGTGNFSFVHVDDAAAATVAAVTRGSVGIYNITDDEPAAIKDWLPVYAKALGAKPPRHVPAWLARLIAGKELTNAAIEMRGASNAKAKAELGWTLEHPTWRTGFSESLR